jgi:hypothetical protein
MRTLMMCGVLLALAMPARATVIVPADLAELSRDARTIVRGRVAALDAQWTEDRGTIETLVTLEVESYLKGALGQMLRFRVPGGELGRFRSIVVGAPEFVVDERVVVFLGTQGPSVPFVLGFNQGVFRVLPASDNSAWVVTPLAMLPAAAEASLRVVRGDPSRRAVALDEFERRVRALLRGQR